MAEEDNKRLYPFKFVPQEEKTSWGIVRYLLADLGYKDSVIGNGWFGGNTVSELMGTYLERVVGDDVFEYYGLQFPVMVKTIEVEGRTPLLVNAGDDVAAQRYDAFGKTAVWYVRKAERGAGIFLGFNREVPAEEFYRRCGDGSLEEVLHVVEPREGEAVLLRPGTVYAATGRMSLVEVAETSELAFSLHGWGEELSGPEENLLEEAFDLIDFHEYKTGKKEGPARQLAAEPEFTVTKVVLAEPLKVDNSRPGSFTVYHCLSGAASLQVPSGPEPAAPTEQEALKAGQTLLVPAELETFYLVPLDRGTELLDITVGKRSVPDSYLDK